MLCKECQKKEYWLQDYERKVQYWRKKYYEKIVDDKPFRTMNLILKHFKSLEKEIKNSIERIKSIPEVKLSDIEIIEKVRCK